MADKNKESGFTVTDRRLFTSEGELRSDVHEEPESSKPAPGAQKETAPKEAASPQPSKSAAAEKDFESEMPPPPTSAEQAAQAEAYKKSSKELDSQVEMSGHSARDLEITFERFLASLYMTAMLQLGLMHEQGGQPQLDLIGARQTIDTLSMLAEKTKGNLTPKEESLLQNALYELRMAYVEVTNAIAKGPQQVPASK